MEKTDNEVFLIMKKEYERQKNGLELIASENFVSDTVLEALGSIMTNKYSEGQIGKRYYGGNDYIDEMEQLCKDRALTLYDLTNDECMEVLGYVDRKHDASLGITWETLECHSLVCEPFFPTF